MGSMMDRQSQELEALQRRNSELSSSLAGSSPRLDALNHQAEVLSRELSEANRNLAEASGKLQETSRKLEEAEQELRAAEQKLEEQAAEAATEARRLMEAESCAGQALEQRTSELRACESRLEVALGELEGRAAAAGNLEADRDALHQQLAETLKELATATTRLEDSDAQLQAAQVWHESQNALYLMSGRIHLNFATHAVGFFSSTFSCMTFSALERYFFWSM